MDSLMHDRKILIDVSLKKYLTELLGTATLTWRWRVGEEKSENEFLMAFLGNKWIWWKLKFEFDTSVIRFQGSRWTQTATQMNGYVGSIQILPDQIQLLNSLLILCLLPIFQKLIYPAFEYCGIAVTSLRKMSLGQVSHHS